MKHEDAQVPPADAGRLETPVRPQAWRQPNWGHGADEYVYYDADDEPLKNAQPLYDQAALDLKDAEIARLRGMLREAMEVRDGPRWPLPGCQENGAKGRALWRRIEAELRA